MVLSKIKFDSLGKLGSFLYDSQQNILAFKKNNRRVWASEPKGAAVNKKAGCLLAHLLPWPT